MKKKIANNMRNGVRLPLILTVGIVSLFLTPFIQPVSFALLTADCQKNWLGECPFEINFPRSVLSVQIAILWGVISVIIIGLGLYLHYRKRKSQ